MDKVRIEELIKKLGRLDTRGMYLDDFLLTWDKTDDEIACRLHGGRGTPAGPARGTTSRPRIFDSGLGISIFRDNSTRTRFSYASACNLLGL